MEWILFKNDFNVTGEDGNIYPLVDGGMKSTLKVYGKTESLGLLNTSQHNSVRRIIKKITFNAVYCMTEILIANNLWADYI